MRRSATRPTVLLGFTLAALLGVVALAIPPAQAQEPYENDTLTVTLGTSARAGIELNIVAGPSGAPGGFTIWWMKLSDFMANGGVWWPSGSPFQLECTFTGTPTLHTAGGTLTSFVLGPNEVTTIEVGDLFDETGITTNSSVELEPAETYVFCGFANAGGGLEQSYYSFNLVATTKGPEGCIFTQGYWKNHPSAWPVLTLTLGTAVSYTQAQLLAILTTPAAGNGLIFMAHQLIATKLNIANGGDPGSVLAAVAAADALIGSLVIPPIGAGYIDPSIASPYTQIFDDYNNGLIGSGDCSTPTRTSTWGELKSLYR